MDIPYILNHLGEERDEYYGAVAPPVFQTSNFCFKTVAEMREQLKTELEVPFYTRGFNPTVATLRKKIAALIIKISFEVWCHLYICKWFFS